MEWKVSENFEHIFSNSSRNNYAMIIEGWKATRRDSQLHPENREHIMYITPGWNFTQHPTSNWNDTHKISFFPVVTIVWSNMDNLHLYLGRVSSFIS